MNHFRLNLELTVFLESRY